MFDHNDTHARCNADELSRCAVETFALLGDVRRSTVVDVAFCRHPHSPPKSVRAASSGGGYADLKALPLSHPATFATSPHLATSLNPMPNLPLLRAALDQGPWYVRPRLGTQRVRCSEQAVDEPFLKTTNPFLQIRFRDLPCYKRRASRSQDPGFERCLCVPASLGQRHSDRRHGFRPEYLPARRSQRDLPTWKHVGSIALAFESRLAMTEYVPPFPQIVLTPEEQARYDRNVTSFLCDAVAEYSSQSGHTNEDAWIHVRRRKQLSIYKSVYGTRDPQVTLFKGTGLIHGPVQDVMDGLYCDTTEDLRACKTLLKYKLVDGSIMNVTERRSDDAPYRFAGIKWFAAKAAWGLSKHRDVLAYERMGTTTDANGNELAYHVLHSIDHPDWPIDAIKGIKREHQVTCFLYRDHDDSHAECFIWSTVYNLDSVAQRLAEYVVAGTLLNVTDCVKSARAKKYSMLMKHAQHNKWPASSLCHICYGRSFMSTNRPCAGCFQSVCKSCSDYRFIFHIDAKTGRPHQQRFCKLCINNTVIIDSLNFEASIKKALVESAETDTEVERVALRGPRTVSSRQNVLKTPAKVNQVSQSVADTSLRSNYLDWASDWSSQDDDDDEYLRERIATGRDRTKSKSNRSDTVSLSDLDAEDKFSPYPATPQSHKQQTEGRNKRVQENRVHQKRRASAYQQPPQYQEPQQRYQSPLDQYTAPRKQPNHEPRYVQQGYPAPLPPFRLPYQSSEPKTPSSARSFTVISSDSDDGVEVAALPLGESGLGLSQFDLGVVEAAPVAEVDTLNLSMYSDDGGHPPSSRRAPRYGRTSHADKDGFLSDLYSLSRSRIHGEHY